MHLAPGTRLGPYEIMAVIGAGGMGEVYRAQDCNLKRDVALKVLPDSLALDPERLSRFRREAEVLAVLNHPNILAIYDVSRQDGWSFLVSELVPGKTLRTVIAQGPLPPRRAMAIGAEVAEGLAAAHAAGVVHRDLKPENIICTPDGRVKILDFGIAKYSKAQVPTQKDATRELSTPTQPGAVMGTPGYMSPEQIRGETVDHRTDIFSLGVTLYEMLAGQRAFSSQSSADVMTATLRDDPPVLPTSLPPEVRRIVDRCLAKDPARRYQSAADLAFALQPAATSASTGEARSSKVSQQFVKIAAAAGLLTLAVVGGWFWRSFSRAPVHLAFQRLTFRDGYIDRALFQPDGAEFTYTAKLSGEPLQTFSGRIGDPQIRELPLAPGARLTALSPSGELAIGISSDDLVGTLGQPMLLARAPSEGGPHREIADRIVTADWAPDGSSMALVRRMDRADRVEYPIGHKLFESSDFQPSFIRISRDGKLLAMEGLRTDSSFHGEVGTLDRSGRYTALYKSPVGSPIRKVPLVWSPNGSEIWFGSLNSSNLGVLYAVSTSGRIRELASLPESAVIDDVDRSGRMLIALTDRRQDIAILNAAGRQSLPWLGGSDRVYLTGNGKTVVFNEESRPEFGRAIYSRSLDGRPAVKLSDGFPVAVSPSGRYVIAWRANADPSYIVVPTGAGEEHPIQIPGYDLGPGAPMAWLAGEKEIAAAAHLPGHDLRRLIVYNMDTGTVRPISSELNLQNSLVASVDGHSLFGLVGETWMEFALPQGTPMPVKGIQPQESILSGASGGTDVYVGGQTQSGVRFTKLDPATGMRTFLRETPDAGLRGVLNADVSPDGQTIVYVNNTIRSTLYLVRGIR